jgi:hypothetical protein
MSERRCGVSWDMNMWKQQTKRLDNSRQSLMHSSVGKSSSWLGGGGDAGLGATVRYTSLDRQWFRWKKRTPSQSRSSPNHIRMWYPCLWSHSKQKTRRALLFSAGVTTLIWGRLLLFSPFSHDNSLFLTFQINDELRAGPISTMWAFPSSLDGGRASLTRRFTCVFVLRLSPNTSTRFSFVFRSCFEHSGRNNENSRFHKSKTRPSAFGAIRIKIQWCYCMYTYRWKEICLPLSKYALSYIWAIEVCGNGTCLYTKSNAQCSWFVKMANRLMFREKTCESSIIDSQSYHHVIL